MTTNNSEIASSDLPREYGRIKLRLKGFLSRLSSGNF